MLQKYLKYDTPLSIHYGKTWGLIPFLFLSLSLSLIYHYLLRSKNFIITTLHIIYPQSSCFLSLIYCHNLSLVTAFPDLNSTHSFSLGNARNSSTSLINSVLSIS